jgi:SAM-dependent methyltransferase
MPAGARTPAEPLTIPVAPPDARILACPVCRGAIAIADGVARCSDCGRSWPAADGYIDFLEGAGSAELGDGWQQRQDQMVAWYEMLAGSPASTVKCFRNDYGSLADTLRGLEGRVLDLGGGIGATREYLPSDAEYVNIDPSAAWLETDWTALVKLFPAVAGEMHFVRGVGEQLPFADRAFDVVLSICSLNHAARAGDAIAEAGRVLRERGRLVLVLEDMEPPWQDLPSMPGRRPRTLAKKLGAATRLRPWPVQADHTRLTEQQVGDWTAGSFALTDRRWILGDPRAPYLLYVLERSS